MFNSSSVFAIEYTTVQPINVQSNQGTLNMLNIVCDKKKIKVFHMLDRQIW